MQDTKRFGLGSLTWLMMVGLLVSSPLWGEPVPACSAAALEGTVASDADPCDPLVDVFTTVDGFTEIVFGGAVPEVPADFFFPGSLPFSGTVPLFGTALSADELGDTAIRRSGDPQFPNGFPSFAPPVAVTVDGLALNSVGSITVGSLDGGQEEWLVSVGLSGSAQPSGSLSARLDEPGGGAFSGNLPILPVVGFVRLADIQAHLAGEIGADQIAVRFLDFGDEGLAPIDLAVTEVPFSTVPPPDSPCPERTFFPGFLPGGEGPVIISTVEPFEPVRHVFEPPPPPKHCAYRHASSTASSAPAKICVPSCPAGLRPFKTTNKCQTVADCPPFVTRTVKCARQGHCLEVYTVVGCQ
jgi:hypothetical protein